MVGLVDLKKGLRRCKYNLALGEMWVKGCRTVSNEQRDSI